MDKPTKFVHGQGGTKLTVLGSFQATLKYRQSQIHDRVYVVQNQPCSLLSRKACEGLGLIRLGEVSEVNPTTVNFREEFPILFKGLGRLKTQYRITLQEDANTVCLYNPRKIPHPLQPKVKSEIESMVQLGVISPVTVPTKWCSGIVPDRYQ